MIEVYLERHLYILSEQQDNLRLQHVVEILEVEYMTVNLRVKFLSLDPLINEMDKFYYEDADYIVIAKNNLVEYLGPKYNFPEYYI